MIDARTFAFVSLLAATAVPFAAAASELPLRKAGLWEMKMGAQGAMPGMTMQHCTDETTDKAMSAAVSPVADETCSRNDVTKTATGYVTAATCTVAGKTSTTQSEITGDFDSAYSVRVTTDVAGAARNVATIEAKWIGSCKPGQKPGDVVMPGGMKININDLNAARGKLTR